MTDLTETAESGESCAFAPRATPRFVVDGAVQVGHKRGRLLGFPTVNLTIDPGQIPQGVWLGAVTLDDGRHLPAAVSVGRRATFEQDTHDGVLLEAHILDFDEDVYGMGITVALYRSIRAQRGYTRVQELIDQLGRDVEAVRKWAKEPDRDRSGADVPGWAMVRADSAVKKQLALGKRLPDSRTLAQLTGMSRHLAKRCLAVIGRSTETTSLSATIGSQHRGGR